MPSLILLLVCLLFIVVLVLPEFVRHDEISLHALMHDQKLIALGSLDIE